MDRRAFLRNGLVATAGFTSFGASVLKRAFADHPTPVVVAEGPYGPIASVEYADENGFRLPDGFESRIIATSGLPVPGTAYPWHHVPDGAATFAAGDGKWIYVCNSEAPGALGGGVSAIRFNAAGEPDGPAAAYRILSGTNLNCAGGPTPWGTWLSCEEHPGGLVWECDPSLPGQGTPRPALGTFSHEAAAVDPMTGYVYLTEDQSDSRFYRFRSAAPFTPGGIADLSAGTLEVARVGDGGAVTWLAVPQPNSVSPATRTQVLDSTAFRGGEGAWYDSGTIYFTTKGDDKVWAYYIAPEKLEMFFHSVNPPGGTRLLNGVDNITVSPGGEIFVCEDHSSAPHQLVMLSPNPTPGGPVLVSPFLELVEHPGSELTGVCFNPAGNRMYLSSQRGNAVNAPPLGLGMTFEITGPFNQ